MASRAHAESRCAPASSPAHVLFNTVLERTKRQLVPGGLKKSDASLSIFHSAAAREERSQAMNKRLARARLTGFIAAGAAAAKADADRDRWAQDDQLERGSSVRTFKGPDFREVR